MPACNDSSTEADGAEVLSARAQAGFADAAMAQTYSAPSTWRWDRRLMPAAAHAAARSILR